MSDLPPSATPVMTCVLTCPHCGARHSETMPADFCVYFFECTACHATLKPKSGDCCVFCSYGSLPCPPIQLARTGHAGDVG